MAKYERRLKGDLNQLLNWLHADITQSSVSASFEDGSDVTMGETKMAVRVYERFSMIGKNRVSLNLVLLGNGDDLFISAITAGGSQAVLFKINVFGEEAFLNICQKSVENYIVHVNNSGV